MSILMGENTLETYRIVFDLKKAYYMCSLFLDEMSKAGIPISSLSKYRISVVYEVLISKW